MQILTQPTLCKNILQHIMQYPQQYILHAVKACKNILHIKIFNKRKTAIEVKIPSKSAKKQVLRFWHKR
jgi:hypothetical protein